MHPPHTLREQPRPASYKRDCLSHAPFQTLRVVARVVRMLYGSLQLANPVEHNQDGSAPIPKMKRSVSNDHRGRLEGDVGYLFADQPLTQTPRMFGLLLDNAAAMHRVAVCSC